jgi:hypothetical protein
MENKGKRKGKTEAEIENEGDRKGKTEAQIENEGERKGKTEAQIENEGERKCFSCNAGRVKPSERENVSLDTKAQTELKPSSSGVRKIFLTNFFVKILLLLQTFSSKLRHFFKPLRLKFDLSFFANVFFKASIARPYLHYCMAYVRGRNSY